MAPKLLVNVFFFNSFTLLVLFRVPTVMERHGKNLVKKSHGKWAEKINSWKLKNILKKSLNFSTAESVLIMNHAREVPIIPYLQAYCSDFAMGGFRFMF